MGELLKHKLLRPTDQISWGVYSTASIDPEYPQYLRIIRFTDLDWLCSWHTTIIFNLKERNNIALIFADLRHQIEEINLALTNTYQLNLDV